MQNPGPVKAAEARGVPRGDGAGEFMGARRSDGFFPVKGVRVSPLPTCGGLSRGVRQRIGRRHMVEVRTNESIRSLNHLSHSVGEADGDSSFGEAIRDRVSRLHTGNTPPDGQPQAKEALRELLGASTSGYLGKKCTVEPYVESLVSWPAVGFRPRSLDGLLESSLSEEVNGLHPTFVEKPAAVRARRREVRAASAYQDPAFRDRGTYVSFVKQLASRGLLRFGLTSRERVTAFFVEKKGGKIRLIFDCRRTNDWFTVPRKVRLISGSSFALMDVSPTTCLYAGGLDVKDAFYRLELPEVLSPYFSLDFVTAGEMGPFSRRGSSGLLSGLSAASCCSDGLELGSFPLSACYRTNNKFCS